MVSLAQFNCSCGNDFEKVIEEDNHDPMETCFVCGYPVTGRWVTPGREPILALNDRCFHSSGRNADISFAGVRNLSDGPPEETYPDGVPKKVSDDISKVAEDLSKGLTTETQRGTAKATEQVSEKQGLPTHGTPSVKSGRDDSSEIRLPAADISKIIGSNKMTWPQKVREAARLGAEQQARKDADSLMEWVNRAKQEERKRIAEALRARSPPQDGKEHTWTDWENWGILAFIVLDCLLCYAGTMSIAVILGQRAILGLTWLDSGSILFSGAVSLLVSFMMFRTLLEEFL
jgi:hypothetical protein